MKPLLDFIEKNKATGTTDALKAMAREKKAYLVVATAEDARKRAPLLEGVKVISMENLLDAEASWMWEDEARAPIFFDPKAVRYLARKLSEG